MEMGVRMWTRWRCWVVAAAAVFTVILPPAAASLSPAGINYEVVALMAIKTELQDHYNVLDNWDINSVDPCSWRMVTCSSDGYVSALLVGAAAATMRLSPVIDGERLKRYVFHKLRTELPEGPFCLLYVHTSVQSEDNNPGMTILRGIYEELPPEYKERLEILYFLHPGLYSWLALATLGRLFLSGGLYWKIKYVSRLEYLWADIKKGEVDIPDFVTEHDKILEHRPLTDYGIEPDPLHLADIPATGYSLGRYEDKWSPEDRWNSRNYM